MILRICKKTRPSIAFPRGAGVILRHDTGRTGGTAFPRWGGGKLKKGVKKHMPNIAKYSEQTFDDIRHINENGQEFWYARELQHVLEYTEWRNFSKAIDRAMTSCKSSGNVVLDHFVEVNKMVSAGVAPKSIDDFMLSRYAC